MERAKKNQVSLFHSSQILSLESYALYNLEPNQLNFSMIMNVPTDGWCLLYAVQFALLIEYGRNIDLLGMRLILLNEFERRTKDEKDEFRVKWNILIKLP